MKTDTEIMTAYIKIWSDTTKNTLADIIDKQRHLMKEQGFTPEEYNRAVHLMTSKKIASLRDIL